MDEKAYRTWWELHLRVARGESLNPEEVAAYEVGLKQLHQEESLSDKVATLRQLRANVVTLETEQERLQARRNKLEAEIAVLETLLNQQTAQLLGVER
jgi:hypothetical protein